MTFTGAAILMMSTGTRLRMQDIANAFQVSPSTVTDYVDHLEKHGYVRRERGNEDRRDVFVAPTHKGREMVIEVRQKTDDYVYDRLMRMTPGERKQFLELLTKFAGEPERITLSILTESRLDKN